MFQQIIAVVTLVMGALSSWVAVAPTVRIDIPALVERKEVATTTFTPTSVPSVQLGSRTAERVLQVSTPDPRASKRNVPSEPLSIGDGKSSSIPRKGYIYSCRKEFNGGGAFRLGAWADESAGLWWPSKKPIVDGAVTWDAASVTIALIGSTRVISANALPTNHTTGNYPVAPTDDAYQYDRNPNPISEQSISYTLDATPEVATTPACVGGEVGIALNGVPIFSGFDAAGRDAAVHEIQDSCNGHPQVAGEYHYHNLSPCIDTAPDLEGRPALIGYALDGFGIYAPQRSGKKFTTADLDECHGRVDEVVFDGKVQKMYHYVATDDFPYTVGCFKGTPVKADSKGGTAPQRPMR